MTYRDISGIVRKAVYAGIGLGLASALTACGRSANQSPTSGLTSSPPTQVSTQASDSPTAGTSNDTLTGFGATTGAWNTRHAEDTRFAPGAAYDPDSALPSYSGQDVYVAVQWQDGRAMNYQMNIQDQPIRDAIARALQELPPDAHELWGARRDTCYQAELTSPALGRALAAPAIGDPEGDVFVEFLTTLPDGSSVYRSPDVNSILIGLGSYPTAASGPAC